jgi:hypothetical protein
LRLLIISAFVKSIPTHSNKVTILLCCYSELLWWWIQSEYNQLSHAESLVPTGCMP